ncbi:MAG TPA: glycosyltransferase family A protein, partial [Polyangiaceae bacterium]|nr:glycosyltransferase family A protein [Polyangiaceae bacterium]
MFASVVVRSYQRREALLELVARLRLQRSPRFEIVILEQSNDPSIVRELDAFGDRRIRVIAKAPTNPPAARNEAIRHCKGEVIVLIDDDD